MTLRTTAGDYYFFDNRTWVLTSPPVVNGSDPRLRVKRKGTLTLWTKRVAVFRSVDGDALTFEPRQLGCA
jgi:hypothetical protein